MLFRSHYRGQPGVDQFELLAHLTGYTVLKGLTRNHPDAHFGNALLTRLPVEGTTTVDLSVPLRAPRGALVAEIKGPGGPVRVCNVHLGLDPWERREQVTRVARVLDDAPTTPTLVLGDFNEWRALPPYLEPMAKRLPGCAMPESYHARRPMLRFDRIYASPELALERAHCIHAPVAKHASDHLPVVASLSWRS